MFYSYTGRRHPKIFNVLFYLIKPQLSQLILPTIVIELKGMADLKKKREKKKKRKKEDKSPNAKEKKDSQILVLKLGRYVIPKEQM